MTKDPRPLTDMRRLIDMRQRMIDYVELAKGGGYSAACLFVDGDRTAGEYQNLLNARNRMVRFVMDHEGKDEAAATVVVDGEWHEYSLDELEKMPMDRGWGYDLAKRAGRLAEHKALWGIK